MGTLWLRGRGVDLPEILHILLALPEFSPLFRPNLGGYPGADPGGGGGVGGRDPPLLLTTNFFFNKLFNYSKKNNTKNRSEYSMDAMYLNLMFINPRPPVGAGAKDARCTRPSLTPPPPPAKNPGSAPAVPVAPLTLTPMATALGCISQCVVKFVVRYRIVNPIYFEWRF